MILKAIVEDQEYSLNVPEHVLAGCDDYCDKLDADMDAGWQMSREWVAQPNREQRCQIVADKLLTALEKENHKLGMLMAAYLLKRLPNVEAVELDIQGEIQNNTFRFRDTPAADTADTATAPVAQAAASAGAPTGLSRMQAMAQAGNDVTKVFKVGKAWRFSVYDHASGTWQDSPLMATEQEAERLRQAAFKERYEALIGAD
ncbi:hypothetical protein [uncultured Thiohalocapsa sp.]|jgi:hypothetical protein|uniref:hypothetical protein n=1 Tax=uncultured Thiohalocapsa sp. TaxID=768990 RepID=UPI0025E177D2|nr:hypothetical protein [uncultured Thiohalocapsa sp.]